MATATQTGTVLETDTEARTEPEGLFDVIPLNNNHNNFQEVALVLQEAVPCDAQRAWTYTLQIHSQGAATVLTAPWTQAVRCAAIIRRIGIQVRVEKQR